MIYFSGIGGVGIGPLAEIALDAGYSIVGSDISNSLMTEYLKKRGAIMSIGPQDGLYLSKQHQKNKIDLFVYTSALPANHPELLKAHELGIKTVKRDELLAQIIKEKNLKLIAIAGTHGKTTTTGMAIWAFSQLGVPVSYSIGSTISFGPSGCYDKNSEYFIYECDEFDKNFLQFEPFLSLITSIDYDHPDTYPDEKSYLDAFRQFVDKSKSVIAWKNQHGELYNDSPNAVLLQESEVADIKLAGLHNRKNATLVLNALKKLGIAGDLTKSIESFPGVDRRFEKIAEGIYSDYAHHPAEIQATLQLASELSDKIVVIYQPHQNLRQHYIKKSYTNQFERAETIYWLPTHLSREDLSLPMVTFDEMTKNITNKNDIQKAELNDELLAKIKKAQNDGKTVLCMGAGSIDTWIRSNFS